MIFRPCNRRFYSLIILAILISFSGCKNAFEFSEESLHGEWQLVSRQSDGQVTTIDDGLVYVFNEDGTFKQSSYVTILQCTVITGTYEAVLDGNEGTILFSYTCFPETLTLYRNFSFVEGQLVFYDNFDPLCRNGCLDYYSRI